MKHLYIGLVGVSLIISIPLYAETEPSGKKLDAKAMAKIAAMVSRVAERERALQTEGVAQLEAEDALLKPVLESVQKAQKQIQKKMEFPQDSQDTARAGMIFQSVTEIMDSYNNLRAERADLSKTAGAFIAKQEFVSKGGQTFTVESFIQQFLSTVQSQKLAEELADFKDHLREDAV